MAPRRLLVVSDEMEVGGSQRQISYLLTGLDRDRWLPELAYFRNDSFLVRELRAQGIVVHHIPKRGRIDLRFLWNYAALLRRQRYELVHAFSLTAELWTMVASLLVPRAPAMVASVRGLYLDQSTRFWRIKRLVLARSAAIIANARAGAEAAAARSGIDRRRFSVVPNGILPPVASDPADIHALRRSSGVPEGRPFGLFVGRLVKEKNLPCLLRALATLDPAQRPWIALAGHGPLHDSLDTLRHELGLEGDVRFLGERDDTARLMQAADFLVLPSMMEGMSNVLMEAMAAGCPVIASDVGGNPELVEDGVTGLLFPDNDHARLAEAILRLTGDPALCRHLASQSAGRIRERHSIDAMVAGTVAVYERSLSPVTATAHPVTAVAPGDTRERT